jgi:hypothetical protein
MSSRQRPVSPRAWTVDAAHPRRCPDCDAHIPPGHQAADGSRRCNDCVEPFGVDR